MLLHLEAAPMQGNQRASQRGHLRRHLLEFWKRYRFSRIGQGFTHAGDQTRFLVLENSWMLIPSARSIFNKTATVSGRWFLLQLVQVAGESPSALAIAV